MKISKYYMKFALRSLINQKRSTLINIIGLAIGFAATAFISVYVCREITYDRFHINYDRIFIPEIEIVDAKANIDIASNFSLDQIDNFRDMVSGIEAISFLNYSRWDWDYGAWVEYRGHKYNLPRMAFTNTDFTHVFSFAVHSGNLSKTLEDPNKMAIPKNIANKIFGKENPIGQTVLLNNKPIVIGAVLDPIPSNSSIQFSGLISYKAAGYFFKDPINDYSNIAFILTRPGADKVQVSESVSSVLYNMFSKEELELIDPKFKTKLLPVKDMYYCYDTPYSPFKHGNKKTSYILLFIGAVTLILALINFNNLLMAVSVKWEKNYFIHQTFGDGRYISKKLFFIKGLFIAFVALVLAVIIVKIALPWFNNLSAYPLYFKTFLKPYSIAITGAMFLLSIGLLKALSGIIQKQNFNVVGSQWRKQNHAKKGILGQGLVIFQLFVSITLISISIVVMKQIQFGMNKDLGLNTKNIVLIPSYYLGNKKDMFINNVKHSTATLSHCLSTSYINNYNIWGGRLNSPTSQSQDVDYTNVRVNEGFVGTLGLKIIEGRDFNVNRASDKNKMIVNKAFVYIYKVTDPIRASIDGYEIIGVVDNFNYNSLRDKIEPLVLVNTPDKVGISSFCFNAETKEELKAYISFLELEWKKITSDIPFEFEFLDDRLRDMYSEEIKLSKTIVTYAILAIFIACMGILGLMSFAIETRIKEIGVRKVNGAGTLQVLQLINLNLLKWLVIAMVISVPIAWFAIQKWLNNFAYRIELGWWVIILAGLIVFVLTILTITWQSWRAARRNPVEALRYE